MGNLVDLHEYYSFYQACSILGIDRAILSHWTVNGMISEKEWLYSDSGKYFYRKHYINRLNPTIFNDDRELIEKINNGEFMKVKDICKLFGITRFEINGMRNRGELKDPDYIYYSSFHLYKTESIKRILDFQNELKNKYFTTKEVLQHLKLSEFQLLEIKRKKMIENKDYFIYKVSCYYLKETILRLKDNDNSNDSFDPTQYITHHEVCKIFNISKSTLLYWRESGRLIENTHYRVIEGRYYFIEDSIQAYNLELIHINQHYYKAIKAAELLKVDIRTLRNWYYRGIFSDKQVKQIHGDFYYSKKKIDLIVSKQVEIDVYYSAKEIANMYGFNQAAIVNLDKHVFFKSNKEWSNKDQSNKTLYNIKVFHEYFVNEFNVIDLSEFISINELVDLFEVEVDTDLLNNTDIYKAGDQTYIAKKYTSILPSLDFGKIKKYLVPINNLPEVYSVTNGEIESLLREGCFGSIYEFNGERYLYKGNCELSLPKGFTIFSPKDESAIKLPFSPIDFINHYVKKGIIQLYEKWIIDHGQLVKRLIYSNEVINTIAEKIESSITHFDAAERLKITISSARTIFTEKFENVVFSSHLGYLVPKVDFSYFEDEYIASNMSKFYVGFDSLSFEEQLKIRFSKLIIPDEYHRTHEMFSIFAQIRLGETEGSSKNKHDFCNVMIVCLKKIIEALPPNKEITMLSDEELNELPHNAHFSKKLYGEMRYFTIWILENRYICKFSSGLPKVFQSRGRETDKEIYTANEYLVYFEFIMDIETHIPKAISSRDYVSAWLFTGFHLNCEFRGIDLLRIPEIPIESIGVTTLDYFNKHRLSDVQATVLINLVSEMFNSIDFISTKTQGSYVFVIHPEHVIAMATAFTIAELHRREQALDFIAQTDESERELSPQFRYLLHIGGKRKKIRSINSAEVMKQFKDVYRKKIFEDPETLPYFESRKMNSSFMTYMYHAITQNSNYPELATALVKRMRGHKKANTTVQYILMNNFDGTLDHACLTLFRRQQFGWIFNELIELLCFDEEESDATVRTTRIEEMRNSISLFQLEQDAGFLLVQQKKEVLESLLSKTKDEIRAFAFKLFTGQLASRKPNCSCYVGKDKCKTILLDCYICPLIIPTENVLKQIGSEIEKSILKMKSENFEIYLLKETQRICKLYVLIKEAILFLGVEKVSVYVDIQGIKQGLLEVDFSYWENRVKRLWSSKHKEIVESKQSLIRNE